jgi:hypothetical protein
MVEEDLAADLAKDSESDYPMANIRHETAYQNLYLQA